MSFVSYWDFGPGKLTCRFSQFWIWFLLEEIAFSGRNLFLPDVPKTGRNEFLSKETGSHSCTSNCEGKEPAMYSLVVLVVFGTHLYTMVLY